jgi:hypothetical protein
MTMNCHRAQPEQGTAFIMAACQGVSSPYLQVAPGAQVAFDAFDAFCALFGGTVSLASTMAALH